jgi:hypothetical protein
MPTNEKAEFGKSGQTRKQEVQVAGFQGVPTRFSPPREQPKSGSQAGGGPAQAKAPASQDKDEWSTPTASRQAYFVSGRPKRGAGEE